MVDRLVAVDTGDYRLPDPVLGALVADVSDESSAIGGALVSEYRSVLKAPLATGSDQTAALNSAISSAATFGIWLQLNGAHVIADQLTVVTGAKIDGSGGSIRQTANLKPAFRISSQSAVRIRNTQVIGKTTDYVNLSSVWAAAAVYVTGTSSDIQIDACSFVGLAGAGVYISPQSSDVHVRNCKMTGAGSAYILNSTYNYSGGIFADSGSKRWSAVGNDISGFSQGIVTGDNMEDIRVLDNYIHDIPGQHGLYLETMNGGVVSGNLVRNCTLLGMKVQIGSLSAVDCTDVTISDNVFKNVGTQGILLDNPLSATTRFRRISITGNVIHNALGGGIEARNCVGLHVADNTVVESKWGIRVASSSQVSIADCRFSTLTNSGVFISDCQDVTVDGVRVRNPGSALVATDRFGVFIDGSTSADITIRSAKITDTGSAMRYGVYLAAGDSTTMDFVDVMTSGATDYGWRMITAGAVRSFRGNSFAGTLGAYLNPPSNFTQNADTSGATLTDIETEVNELKAVLRANGLIRA